jgi:NAD(P)-dependent dehydrogenase (short-subunit alcohol dehydrogenase family)
MSYEALQTTPFGLRGRRALVTGSTQGIGQAIADALAEAGAAVCFHGLAADKGTDARVERLREAGAGAAFHCADLACGEQVRGLARFAMEALGGVDILVLNASVQVEKPYDEQTDAEIDWQLGVNLRSGIQLVQKLAPGMLGRGWGRILALGSIQEHKPAGTMPVYAATKAAQTNLVMSLARRFARQGVTVNSIAPGFVRTPRTEETFLDPKLEAAKWAPMRREGYPADFAGAALLLCSDAGAYITGASLPVDGGMSAG